MTVYAKRSPPSKEQTSRVTAGEVTTMRLDRGSSINSLNDCLCEAKSTKQGANEASNRRRSGDYATGPGIEHKQSFRLFGPADKLLCNFLPISNPTILIKQKGHTARAYPLCLVQVTGFEPTRISSLEPETSASAVPPHLQF